MAARGFYSKANEGIRGDALENEGMEGIQVRAVDIVDLTVITMQAPKKTSQFGVFMHSM